jgi:hypothetical protein
VTRALVLLATVSLGAAGCGHALGQTAKTEPVGHTRMNVGVIAVTNENDEARHGFNLRNVGGELSTRVGLAENVDVGVSTWIIPGIRSDLKWSLFDRHHPYALALRAGGGLAAGSTEVVMAMAGTIASYDLGKIATPYVGATFANHWVYPGRQPPPPRGERYAPRAGYGDGLLQLAVGLQLVQSRGAVWLFEYQYWRPMQNDPGDFYKFVPNHVAFVGWGFCLASDCDWF